MKKPLPNTEKPLVLRTDFTDDKAWDDICHVIGSRVSSLDTEFQAYMDFVNDPEYDGLITSEILSLLPDEICHVLMFVVDRETMKNPGHPLLCIDLVDSEGKSLRVAAMAVQGVENNLSTGNFCFDELVEMVEEDGVFTGVDL